MIHVQIASHVTATGISGVRWVLLDDAERPAPPEAQPEPPRAIGDYRQAPPEASGPRGGFALQAWKGGVLLLGLGLALWIAQAWFGPAALPWRPVPPSVDAVKPAREAPPLRPAAPAAGDEQPLPPAPPASVPGPVITASRT